MGLNIQAKYRTLYMYVRVLEQLVRLIKTRMCSSQILSTLCVCFDIRGLEFTVIMVIGL